MRGIEPNREVDIAGISGKRRINATVRIHYVGAGAYTPSEEMLASATPATMATIAP